ncbi:MAG: hypothetical protein H6Q52_2195 [Deltaproteobacteria bacterium]|nr:hypothetical protein [Deltaproteobacteria bacterium]
MPGHEKAPGKKVKEMPVSNDFIGDLSKNKLLDLMTPLLSKKKSGMIRIRGHEIGEIYLEGSNIIHAKTGEFTGEEAVLAMMEWNSGRATFDWEAPGGEQTVFMPTEQLLMIGKNRESEWVRIRDVIPSSNAIFQIPIDGCPDNRRVHANQWKVLALCNGVRSVAEIAEILNWQIFETSQTIWGMVQDGLLAKSGQKKTETITMIDASRTVSSAFFLFIENELKKIMGPIAPIVIEDTLADFGESRDHFPEDRLSAFVQAVSQEVSDASKRTQFTRNISEHLAHTQK